MKPSWLGEEQRFFPSFFPILYVFLLVWTFGCLSLAPAIEGAEKDKLSRFDRLAQEASLLNQRGQPEKVIALLEPLSREPQNESALFFNELGVAYRRQGRLGEAIQAYRQGLIRDPENAVVMKNLGDVLYLNKEYPQAVEQLQRVVKSNPRFEQAHYSLGLAYYRMGKYPEALEEFEAVLKLNPREEQARKFREAILKKIKK